MRNLTAATVAPDFDAIADRVLARVREELVRGIRLQHEGRFALACSDPANTDADNFAIALEESLEVVKEMQGRPIDEDHLEEEILQAAATYTGWLIARERRKAT
jgi:hypothetical protein